MTLTCNVSASDHIRGVISDCTQTQYALRVPRSHGLNTAGLQTHLPTCSCVEARLNRVERLYHDSRSSACQRILASQQTLRFLSARSDDIRTAVRSSRPAALQQQLFTVCYLPYQQRHNITNCTRDHTTDTYLKELQGRLTDLHFLTRFIHKDTY